MSFYWKINEYISAKKEGSDVSLFFYMTIYIFSIYRINCYRQVLGLYMQTNVKVRQTQRTLNFFIIQVSMGFFLYLK